MIDYKRKRSQLVKKLKQYEDIYKQALSEKSFTPACKALDQARTVSVLIEQLDSEVYVSENIPKTIEQHQVEMLINIRKMRAASTAQGSYIAAQKLLETEKDIYESIYSEETNPESDEALLLEIANIVNGLPDILKQKFDDLTKGVEDVKDTK